MNLGIIPKTLYRTSSNFSGEIKVVKKGKEKQLLVGGYVQSINWDCPGIEKRVWGVIASEVGKLFSICSACGVIHSNGNEDLTLRATPSVSEEESRSHGERFLVLGLGAGTEIHLLSQKYPKASFTAVEIDPEIIKIAKKYFNIGDIPNLKISNEDVFKFFKPACYHDSNHDSRPWDLIICDIYAGGKYPPEAEVDWFLERIASATRTAIFNRIFDSLKDPAAQDFLKRIRRYFPKVEEVAVHHKALNILFVCDSIQH